MEDAWNYLSLGDEQRQATRMTPTMRITSTIEQHPYKISPALQSVQITIEMIIATAADSAIKLDDQYGAALSLLLCCFFHLDNHLEGHWNVAAVKDATWFGGAAGANVELQLQVLFVAVVVQLIQFMMWVTSVTLQLREQLGVRIFHTMSMKAAKKVE